MSWSTWAFFFLILPLFTHFPLFFFSCRLGLSGILPPFTYFTLSLWILPPFTHFTLSFWILPPCTHFSFSFWILPLFVTYFPFSFWILPPFTHFTLSLFFLADWGLAIFYHPWLISLSLCSFCCLQIGAWRSSTTLGASTMCVSRHAISKVCSSQPKP